MLCCDRALAAQLCALHENLAADKLREMALERSADFDDLLCIELEVRDLRQTLRTHSGEARNDTWISGAVERRATDAATTRVRQRRSMFLARDDVALALANGGELPPAPAANGDVQSLDALSHSPRSSDALSISARSTDALSHSPRSNDALSISARSSEALSNSQRSDNESSSQRSEPGRMSDQDGKRRALLRRYLRRLQRGQSLRPPAPSDDR